MPSPGSDSMDFDVAIIFASNKLWSSAPPRLSGHLQRRRFADAKDLWRLTCHESTSVQIKQLKTYSNLHNWPNTMKQLMKHGFCWDLLGIFLCTLSSGCGKSMNRHHGLKTQGLLPLVWEQKSTSFSCGEWEKINLPGILWPFKQLQVSTPVLHLSYQRMKAHLLMMFAIGWRLQLLIDHQWFLFTGRNEYLAGFLDFPLKLKHPFSCLLKYEQSNH